MKLRNCKLGDRVRIVIEGTVKNRNGESVGVLSDATALGSVYSGNYFRSDTIVERIETPLGAVGDKFTFVNQQDYVIEAVLSNGDWAARHLGPKNTGYFETTIVRVGSEQTQSVRVS